MKTKTYEEIETAIELAYEFVSPLLTLLNDQYCVDPKQPYEVPLPGQLCIPDDNPRVIAIELPDQILRNEMATRAIATLLQHDDPNMLRPENPFTETDRHMEFDLVKRSFWFENYWQWNRFLMICNIELGLEATEREMRLLVAFLSNPSNLVTLKPDDIAAIF